MHYCMYTNAYIQYVHSHFTLQEMYESLQVLSGVINKILYDILQNKKDINNWICFFLLFLQIYK